MTDLVTSFLVGVVSSLVAAFIAPRIGVGEGPSMRTSGVVMLCLGAVQFPALWIIFFIAGNWKLGLGSVFSGMSCFMIGGILISFSESE
jgi:hypothetical protein